MKVPRRTADPVVKSQPGPSPFALVSLVAPFALTQRTHPAESPAPERRTFSPKLVGKSVAKAPVG